MKASFSHGKCSLGNMRLRPSIEASLTDRASCPASEMAVQACISAKGKHFCMLHSQKPWLVGSSAGKDKNWDDRRQSCSEKKRPSIHNICDHILKARLRSSAPRQESPLKIAAEDFSDVRTRLIFWDHFLVSGTVQVLTF